MEAFPRSGPGGTLKPSDPEIATRNQTKNISGYGGLGYIYLTTYACGYKTPCQIYCAAQVVRGVLDLRANQRALNFPRVLQYRSFYILTSVHTHPTKCSTSISCRRGQSRHPHRYDVVLHLEGEQPQAHSYDICLSWTSA